MKKFQIVLLYERVNYTSLLERSQFVTIAAVEHIHSGNVRFSSVGTKAQTVICGKSFPEFVIIM